MDLWRWPQINSDEKMSSEIIIMYDMFFRAGQNQKVRRVKDRANLCTTKCLSKNFQQPDTSGLILYYENESFYSAKITIWFLE